MKLNVGGNDRNFRIGLGIIMVLVAVFSAVPTWRIIGVVVAVVAFATAFVRFCPINAVLGINTCETEEPGEHTLHPKH